MGIDLQTLGTKLAKYRNQLAESVAEVATDTGIEIQRLEAIEDGRLEPTGDEILILADHFRCDYNFFISNERVAPFEQTETLYRAHGRDFSKNDRRAIQEFLYLCESEAYLMERLGRARQEFTVTPVGNFYKAHGADAAARLRQALHYADDTVPRDVYSDFRQFGVHIFRRRLETSKISGVFVMHPVAGKCALVNAVEDIYRQRFSAAHEMAHAIFDAGDAVSVTYEQSPSSDLREIRANRFASCFLMPPVVLARLPDPMKWGDADVVRWANAFRVSCQALGIALKEAGLIDSGASNQMRQLRVPRELKVDPELPDSLLPAERERKSRLLDMGLSDAYVDLCFDGLREGVISIGRLAEVLLSSTAETAELADLYGRTLYGD